MILSSRGRLVLAAVLFAGWIGYLGILALTTAQPIILARPQFLVSTLDVIARVEGENGQPAIRVRIEEVHWPDPAPASAGQEIEVANLGDAEGWSGPGQYILPLVDKDGRYQVAPLPRSPGFVGTRKTIHPPRIYPVTADTRKQLELIDQGKRP